VSGLASASNNRTLTTGIEAFSHSHPDQVDGLTGPKRPKIFREKYNRFTTENAPQLQCKALRRLQKIRRRNNNGEQWKNNAQNNGNSRRMARPAQPSDG